MQLPVGGETVVRERWGVVRTRVRYVVGGRPGPWLVNPRLERRTDERVAMVGEVDGAERLLVLDLRTLQLQVTSVDGLLSSALSDGANRVFLIVTKGALDRWDDETPGSATVERLRPASPPVLLEGADGHRLVAELDVERFGSHPVLCAFAEGALWVQGRADLFRIDERTAAIENVTATVPSASPRVLLRADRVQNAWLLSFADGGVHVLRGSDRMGRAIRGKVAPGGAFATRHPRGARSRRSAPEALASLAARRQLGGPAHRGLRFGMRWRPSTP